jgi:Fe-S-cluster containining protein
LRTSSCTCKDCRAACTNSPGWFLPEQVARLAEHLELSPAETFRRHLAVGVTSMPDGSLRHGVMPHKLRDRKKPGSVWTLDELAVPGRCVFFDRGRCTIHPLRPHECACMTHGPEHDAVKLRHEIVARWDDKALDPYRKLTGMRLFGSTRRPRRKR